MYREYLSCNDVLLVPRHSDLDSRKDCDTAFYDPNLVTPYSLPVMASPMDRVYSKEMDAFLTEKRNIPVVVHRYFPSYKEQIEAAYKPLSSDLRFFAVGSIKNRKWIDGLLEEGIRHFCVDMAHGDTSLCTDTVKYLVHHGADKVIAGNVATKSGFGRLQDAGAWAIRCGIGSGSICSTRTQTGFGVPLLTCVEDCAAKKDTALVIADGGMSNCGDLMKAIAFGADMCMMGRMFAGTDLAPGDCYSVEKQFICGYNEMDERIVLRGIADDNPEFFPTYRELTAFKEYRGMASAAARKGVMKKASIEGVSGLIPYTGSTEAFVDDLALNMEAALSYAGLKCWNRFRRDVKKIRISNASWNESLTHVIN